MISFPFQIQECSHGHVYTKLLLDLSDRFGKLGLFLLQLPSPRNRYLISTLSLSLLGMLSWVDCVPSLGSGMIWGEEFSVTKAPSNSWLPGRSDFNLALVAGISCS